MQTLRTFTSALHDHGIQTRLIECVIPMDCSLLDSSSAAIDSGDDECFMKEYELLNASSSDLIAQALHFSAKEKNTSLVVILELLIELHQKVSRLEQHLLEQTQARLTLKEQRTIHALGHGVLCCREASFMLDRFYYVRFALPNAQQRDIGLFARAISPEILQIARIHSSNTSALDSFIVAKEMEQLRQKRTACD